MNHISIMGRLGHDPEQRTTPSGKQAVTFSLAVPSGSGEGKQTMWVRCVAWDKTADLIAQHFKQGSRILIEGSLSIRKYEKDGDTKFATEVVVARFHFIDKRGEPVDEEQS